MMLLILGYEIWVGFWLNDLIARDSHINMAFCQAIKPLMFMAVYWCRTNESHVYYKEKMIHRAATSDWPCRNWSLVYMHLGLDCDFNYVLVQGRKSSNYTPTQATQSAGKSKESYSSAWSLSLGQVSEKAWGTGGAVGLFPLLTG